MSFRAQRRYRSEAAFRARCQGQAPLRAGPVSSLAASFVRELTRRHAPAGSGGNTTFPDKIISAPCAMRRGRVSCGLNNGYIGKEVNDDDISRINAETRIGGSLRSQ